MPSGRPVTLFSAPELYNASNCITVIASDELGICREEAVFPADCVCSDTDVYEICKIYMEENNWQIPNNAFEAAHLYLKLRMKLGSDL